MRMIVLLILPLSVAFTLACADDIGTVQTYTVCSVDSNTFIENIPVTLREHGDGLLVVVAHQADSLSSVRDDTGWVPLRDGLTLRMRVKKADTTIQLRPISLYSSRPPLIVYPLLSLDAVTKSIEEGQPPKRRVDPFDTDSIPDTLIFYDSWKVMCNVYISDDILGTYVKKSAVVKRE